MKKVRIRYTETHTRYEFSKEKDYHVVGYIDADEKIIILSLEKILKKMIIT